MQRPIKFRAWDKIANEMYSPKSFKRRHYGLNYQTDSVELSFSGMEHAEQVLLMQYTGLKDKNGVEIYEGDIVVGYPDIASSASKVPAIVSMWDMSWCAGHEQLSNNDDSIEVLGNIYENSELLEAGE